VEVTGDDVRVDITRSPWLIFDAIDAVDWNSPPSNHAATIHLYVAKFRPIRLSGGRRIAGSNQDALLVREPQPDTGPIDTHDAGRTRTKHLQSRPAYETQVGEAFGRSFARTDPVYHGVVTRSKSL
jgi:hypothetical protein